jgi:hypothetical protein
VWPPASSSEPKELHKPVQGPFCKNLKKLRLLYLFTGKAQWRAHASSPPPKKSSSSSKPHATLAAGDHPNPPRTFVANPYLHAAPWPQPPRSPTSPSTAASAAHRSIGRPSQPPPPPLPRPLTARPCCGAARSSRRPATATRLRPTRASAGRARCTSSRRRSRASRDPAPPPPRCTGESTSTSAPSRRRRRYSSR